MKTLDFGVSTNGLSVIRWFSQTNFWQDVAIVVRDEEFEEAKAAVVEGSDIYFEKEDSCYGDEIEEALQRHGIKHYVAYYHSDEDESPEYEDEWEAFLTKVLGGMNKVEQLTA